MKITDKDDNAALKANLKSQKQYGSLLLSAVRNYQDSKKRTEDKVGSILKWGALLSAAYLATDRAIKNYNKVKEYGYTTSAPNAKAEFTKLKELGEKAEQLVSSDIDHASSQFEEFKSKINGLLSKGNIAGRDLATIQSAERQNKGAKSEINQDLNTMSRYEKWSKKGEELTANRAAENFLALQAKTDKKEILTINKALKSALGTISDITDKWKGRKRREEEEAERKRREKERKRREKRRREQEEEDRRRRASYSSSSSSSSSSFGGFGGGSSGGGGASGGW